MPAGKKRTWRDTLFFWRGSLTLHDASVSWEGTWVGSDGAEPPDASFAEAGACTFAVRGPAGDVASFLAPDGAGGAGAVPRLLGTDDGTRGRFDFAFAESAYELDDAQKTDDAHQLVVVSGGRGTADVAAFGHNEFGRFISFGTASAGADARTVILTLARRYLRDDDPRAAIRSADEVRQLMRRRLCEVEAGGPRGAGAVHAAMLPVRG